MKKLIRIKLEPQYMDLVQYIANTDSKEVLVSKKELGLFKDFMTKEEERTQADYVLFELTK